ncbi:hypothetical protein P4O66_015055 [Electrophorus voltai]|uniref:Uncharacterized protein n=1 Tax=Electrophorus voltai TaxID=2609070 RepID=A0AAD9DRH2_9TELE|nr:hypothetical protein P4O66_015055 [Electrophorus voltai]
MAPWTSVSTDMPTVDEWMQRSKIVWEETHQHIDRLSEDIRKLWTGTGGRTRYTNLVTEYGSL